MENNEKKITIWGDSILKGIVLNLNNSFQKYSVLPSNAVNLTAENFNVEISNRCYFGCTTTKGISVLTKDISHNISSDIGIIEFGGNDCDYDWTKLCEAPDQPIQPRTPVKIFIETMQKMINILREHCIKPVMMTLPPLVSDRYFNTISQGRDEKIIYNWLGDKEYLYRWQEMYSSEVEKLALKNNVFLIDMRKAFLEEHNYQRLICDDGIHPNSDGHKFMYNVFKEELDSTGFATKKTA